MDSPPKIPGWGWVKIRSGMHGTFIHVEEENDEEEESQSNLANKNHFVGGGHCVFTTDPFWGAHQLARFLAREI